MIGSILVLFKLKKGNHTAFNKSLKNTLRIFNGYVVPRTMRTTLGTVTSTTTRSTVIGTTRTIPIESCNSLIL